LHGPRRPRVCARKIKSPLSAGTSTLMANPARPGITAHVHASYHQPVTRRRKSVTAARGPRLPCIGASLGQSSGGAGGFICLNQP
jgi:hypothetical protein